MSLKPQCPRRTWTRRPGKHSVCQYPTRPPSSLSTFQTAPALDQPTPINSSSNTFCTTPVAAVCSKISCCCCCCCCCCRNVKFSFLKTCVTASTCAMRPTNVLHRVTWPQKPQVCFVSCELPFDASTGLSSATCTIRPVFLVFKDESVVQPSVAATVYTHSSLPSMKTFFELAQHVLNVEAVRCPVSTWCKICTKTGN